MSEGCTFCTIQLLPQHGGVVPDPFWLGQNGCWPLQRSQLFQVLPLNHFLLCCPLNNRRRVARSFSQISPLFFLFLYLVHAGLHLLLFLLLLMRRNIHLNPGLIFPCRVCAENVTWCGKRVQCCTCSKWVR